MNSLSFNVIHLLVLCSTIVARPKLRAGGALYRNAAIAALDDVVVLFTHFILGTLSSCALFRGSE